MRDFARHKLLLGLASSLVKQSSRDGIALPSRREDAICHPYFSVLNIYDPNIPITEYLKDTLGDCLRLINDEDYLVLKAHVHSIQHDGVDLLTADNIVFSGGGGKGIGYSGLIKYLSSNTNYVFNGSELISFIKRSFPDASVPRDSKFYFATKLSKEDLITEIKAAIPRPSHAAHAFYLLAHHGIIQERTSLETVKAVSGTSAGAITALPVALGMNYEDYSKLMIHSQFNHFFLSSSDVSSRLARIGNPDLYRNLYVKKFSEMYIQELTDKLNLILPGELDLDDKDDKKALMSSLLENATPYGIDYLYHRAKGSGILSEITKSVEDRINEEIENDKPSLIRRFFRARTTRLTNSLEHAKDDFRKHGGFKSKESTYGYSSPDDEAFYISLYQQSNSDNISMFFGKLISNRLKNIDIEVIRKAAPGKYEDAFVVNPRNATSIIDLAVQHLNTLGQPLSDQSIYKTCHKMCTLRSKELYKRGMPVDICIEKTLSDINMPVKKITSGERQVLDNALNIIESLYLDKRRTHSLSDYVNDNKSSRDIMTMPSVHRACSRSLRNDLGSLTFKELHSLKIHAPQEGFKDIHIAATGSRFFKKLMRPRTVYFSHAEHSYMPIQSAIRASMSLPGLFKSTKFNNLNLYDGGILENTPIKPFIKNRSTIVAMAENDEFFKSSSTFIDAWKKTAIGKFMYKTNEYRNKFSLSESMRGIFNSSHHYATTNFSFTPPDLEVISGANREVFDQDKGITRDSMYYFLKHKDLSSQREEDPFISDGNNMEEGLHKGVFSAPGLDENISYGKTMLELASEYEEGYETYGI